MKTMPRGAFPTESRSFVAPDDGGYRSHILAHCCKCGFEGALPCAKHSSTVPSVAGQQMFRHKGWKMAPNNRSRDVCPICAGKARIASASEEGRTEQKLRLVHDLLLVAQADPNFLGQNEYGKLLHDFPDLVEAAEEVVLEWEAQKRAPIPDTFARVEAVVQAALARLREENRLDVVTLGEIDERIADIYALMAESNHLKALDLKERDAAEAQDKEEQHVNTRPARNDTALGAAYIKAQTDKIKQAGAARPAIEPAALPPVKKSPNRVKRTGGWDDLTPEEHAERVARMTAKRSLAFAKKAGLSLEEWTRRNEARKAEAAARKKAPKAPPALRVVAEAPKPAAPQKAAETTPVLVHDNTINPTAAGVMDRIRITEALRTHYVPATSEGEGGYYLEDLSDAKLAAMLDMPKAWVTERREVLLFGDDVNAHTAQNAGEIQDLLSQIVELKALQDKLFDTGAQEVEAIEQRQAALLARIQQDTKQLLNEAAEKVADAAADIESRVVEIEQRVRALAGG